MLVVYKPFVDAFKVSRVKGEVISEHSVDNLPYRIAKRFIVEYPVVNDTLPPSVLAYYDKFSKKNRDSILRGAIYPRQALEKLKEQKVLAAKIAASVDEKSAATPAETPATPAEPVKRVPPAKSLAGRAPAKTVSATK